MREDNTKPLTSVTGAPVCGSTTLMPVIGVTRLASGEAIPVSCTRRMEAATSSASKLVPSWKVTPSCRWNV